MTLSDEVECDEAYVIAGHKGQPEVVKSKAEKDVNAGSKAKLAEGPWRKKGRQFLG